MHPPSHNLLLLLLLLDLSSLTTPNLYLNRFNHRQKVKTTKYFTGKTVAQFPDRSYKFRKLDFSLKEQFDPIWKNMVVVLMIPSVHLEQ